MDSDPLPNMIQSDESDSSYENHNLICSHLKQHEINQKHREHPKRYSQTQHHHAAVGFSTIEIRTYPIILGDNPACDGLGPPLTIDWEPETTKRMNVDAYEERKELSNGGRHKRMNELKIGGFFRQRILRRSCACTKEDIKNTMQEMDSIRNSRSRSRKWYLWREKMKKILFGRPTSKRNDGTISA